jgi:hypothetical protein
MTPRFLIDEHLLGALPDAIVRHNRHARVPIDAVSVGGPAAPPRGTADIDLLRWAQRERRIILTRDQSTMPTDFGRLLASGESSAGILIVRRKASLSGLLEWLMLMTECATVEEWTNRLEYVE